MTLNKNAKIALIVAIVVLVAGVWGLKMYGDRNAESGTPSASSSGETSASAYDSGPLDLDELKAAGLPILLNFGTGEG